MASCLRCGGLGGGALEGNIPPHFHCTCPPVGESQVYGPSLSPADVAHDKHVDVAAGCTTGIHEVATLFSHTQDPCHRWEDLGFGKAALLYQRTQQVLKAARLLPAHRRPPHKAEMARNLLAPIPFREVFVILALFLPQLSFLDGASTQRDLWTSPTVQKHGLQVDITPTVGTWPGMPRTVGLCSEAKVAI